MSKTFSDIIENSLNQFSANQESIFKKYVENAYQNLEKRIEATFDDLVKKSKDELKTFEKTVINNI